MSRKKTQKRDFVFDSSQISELLSFIDNISKIESIDVLFSSIDLFVKKINSKSRFSAVSVPIKNSSSFGPLNNKTFLRRLWNKKNRFFQNDSLIKLLKQNNKKKQKVTSFKEESDGTLFFTLGLLGDQAVIVLVKNLNLSNYELVEHFIKNTRNRFELLEKVKELSEAKNLMHLDDVTGLYNQRKLKKDLDEAIQNYKNSKNEFSILFLDIDHFKKVNDGYGHLIGSELLAQLGALIKNIMRNNDKVYRYGGDEFVLLIPNIKNSNAIKIANRILNNINTHEFILKKNKFFKMSVSIGVAEYPKDASSSEEIIEIADRMMYLAKKNGRSRVCHVSHKESTK